MDYIVLLKAFSELGPGLGAVAAIGTISYFIIKLMTKVITKVLDMFDRHGEALNTIKENMDEHTRAVSSLTRNIESNTKTTDQFIRLLERRP